MEDTVDKTVQSSAPKYLFDLHNFDAGAMPDEPAEPVFSGEDMARARTEGYNEGHKMALEDAQASRDQQIVEITSRLTRDLQTLFAAEKARATMFQAELARLIKGIFDEAFPILGQKIGLDQMMATIHAIFEALGPHADIHVEVAPDDLNDVSLRLKPYLGTIDTQFHIQERADLAPGSFELKWQDGGALRDTQKLKTDILAAIDRALAESPEKTHTSP